MKHITALTLLVGNLTKFLANNWDSSPHVFQHTDLETLERITSLLTPDQVYTKIKEDLGVCNSIELVKEDRTVGGGPNHAGKFVVGSSFSTSSPSTCDFAAMDEALLSQTSSTILFPHADLHFNELSDLSCSVQGELGHVTGINVYLSPPNSHGFLLHRDGHDLLVVQTWGKKIWTICEPIHIHDRFNVEGKHFGEGWEPSEKEYNCYNRLLEPGNVLYLPRGTLHRPSTTEIEGSLHLSIGIDVRGFRWVDVIVAHLREDNLITKLSKEALTASGSKKEAISMKRIAFNHPVSGEWMWHTLVGAFAATTPTLKNDLGMLTRAAFPMHMLALWGENETLMYDANGKGKYVEMINLMVEACPVMMESVVLQFHATLGDTPGTVTAKKEAQHVASKCGSIIKEAFPPTSFKFLAQNLMFGAQRLWERRCILKDLKMTPISSNEANKVTAHQEEL